MPAASAFGPVYTRPCPTSRGHGRFFAFLVGRERAQTAASPRAGTCRLRRVGRRCLAPTGQGALREGGGDAVCPDGAKALLCGAPDFGGFTGKSTLRGGLPFRRGRQARWEGGGDAVCPDGAKALLCGAPDCGGFTGKSMLWGGLPFRKGWQARREDGGRGSAVGKGWIYTSYAGHAVLWVKTRTFPASPFAAKTVFNPSRDRHIPPPSRGENGGLCPHPPKGPVPWVSLFGERLSSSPLPPSPKTPQAASPCAWACRRLRARPPQAERNAARPPPARGADARLHGAEGSGRRHCRPMPTLSASAPAWASAWPR